MSRCLRSPFQIVVPEVRDNFREVEDLISKADTWDYPKKAVVAVEPLLMLLRLFDGDTPCLGKVILYENLYV